MKSKMTYKNGLPKVSGLLLIVAIVGIFCLVNCMVTFLNTDEDIRVERQISITEIPY